MDGERRMPCPLQRTDQRLGARIMAVCRDSIGEKGMKQQKVGQAVADLTEAVAIQAEVAHDRLALEWGHIVVTRLLKVWKQLESHDALAYEDKVAAQVRILEEGTSSLWHLHKALVRKIGRAHV